MRISSIKIKNLRSIEELNIALPAQLTTIVGPNSSGKSNILRAFELFFSGEIDLRAFSATYDMPSWIMNATAPAARTSIHVEFDLSAPTSARLWNEVVKLFTSKGWSIPLNKKITIIRYFSRGDKSGYQCVIPLRGTGDSECLELEGLAELLIRRVEFRYVPSLKDLQSHSFRKVTEELKSRLLSVWAGGDRKEVSEKRERFQAIRTEIEELIQDSAKGLSGSLKEQFPEVTALKLAMASKDLEDMIGSLDIFADDGHETLMRQKGSGVQGASIIHMLRILRETAPKGANNKQLFLWCVEEPETFLHPTAQRRLARLLREQSVNTQILFTTHSPHFVSRSSPASNILVNRVVRENRHCTTRTELPREDPMKPIRESLGTSLGDSLALHDVVILAEGISDVTIFTAALSRICQRGQLKFDPNLIAFISGHGASQQATALSILRSWSPLGKASAIFDFDKAGRDDGARRLKNAKEDKDYFFLPHDKSDVTLEDLYPASIKSSAETNGALAQVITTLARPNGEIISQSTDWNKSELAKYFCENATNADWRNIEQFIKKISLRAHKRSALERTRTSMSFDTRT